MSQWQTQGLLETYTPALEHADLDVTVKPIYGHQEGAEVGYNPHRPGRPSHAFNTIFLRTLRVALDVKVHSGKEHAAVHGLDEACGGCGIGWLRDNGLGWFAGTAVSATNGS